MSDENISDDVHPLDEGLRTWQEWRRLEAAGELTTEDKVERVDRWVELYRIRISTTLIARWFAVGSNQVRNSLADRGIVLDSTTRLNSSSAADAASSLPQSKGTVTGLGAEVETILEGMEAAGEVNFYRAWKSTVGDKHLLNYSVFCDRAERFGYRSSYRKPILSPPPANELFERFRNSDTTEAVAQGYGVSSRTLIRWTEDYPEEDLESLRIANGFDAGVNPFNEIRPRKTAKIELSNSTILEKCLTALSVKDLADELGVSESTIRRRLRKLTPEDLLVTFRELVNEGRLSSGDEVEIPTMSMKVSSKGVFQLPFESLLLAMPED